MGPSQLSLWINFLLNLMVTYYLNFLLSIIHWDNLENCKVWIESSMIMFGASCKPVILKIHLGWAFKMTKCFGHLCYQNDFCPLFQCSFVCNEVSWNRDGSQFLIFEQCFMKSLIYTIICKFCNSSPTCLQTCNSKIYYVHKLPNISKVVIHLGPMPIRLQTISVNNPFKR